MTFPRNTPGFQNPGIITARILVIEGNTVTGLFEYAGNPGPGNPPIAYSTQSLADPFGNALPISGGFVANNSPNNSWAQLTAAGVSAGLKMSDTNSNLWTLVSAVIAGTSAIEILGPINSGLFIKENAGGGALSIVAQDPAQPLGTLETWHNIVPVGNFAAGSTTPRFRLEPVGSRGVVRLSGLIDVTGAVAANTVFFTMPTGYIPSRTHLFLTASNTTGANFNNATYYVDNLGNLTIGGAAANGQVFWLDGTYELD
jgi:hypothetical protein